MSVLKRSKPLLKRCFPGLTKNLFPSCRSNPHSKNMNYEYLEYSRNASSNGNMINETTTVSSDDQTMIESRPAAASTMINEYGGYTLMSNSQIYDDDDDDQTEMTRNATIQADNHDYFATNSSADDTMTLEPTQRQTSPIANHQPQGDYYYYYTNGDQNSSFDCMHSTQISNSDTCFQCQVPQNLSPMSNASTCSHQRSETSSSSSYLSERPISPISPPPPSLLTTINSNNSNYENVFFDTTSCSQSLVELSTFDSMIEYFSETLSSAENTQISGDDSTSSSSNSSHVCSSAYEATFVEDVSVHFADTVRIIRDNNDEWLYVRVATDGRQGYVPRNIVMDLKQFVDQLVKTRADLFNNQQQHN